MSRFLKHADKVRSLVRGIEANTRSLELSKHSVSDSVKKRVKKDLEELSAGITELYQYLEEPSMSTVEMEKRKGIIEEFEMAQRMTESRLLKVEEGVKAGRSAMEIMKEDDKSLDEIWNATKTIKAQAYGMNYELKSHNSLLTDIRGEVDESIGLSEKGMQKLATITGYFPDKCLAITICVLIIIFILLLVN